MERPIYLDNHATTRLDPRVLRAMMPWLTEEYGNPSSRSHSYGWRAEEAIETARGHVATLMGADPHEVIFTSGATEANNNVIKGVGASVITTAIEHKSVLAPCSCIEAAGHAVYLADVDLHGALDIDDLRRKVRTRPGLVSVMMANNEVGTIQPLRAAFGMWPEGTLFHSDMAQALGKIPVDVKAEGVHFASFSAHKLHGPKGVGALYVEEQISHKLPAFIHGGGQEHGARSGTLNVPAIVGFGEACRLAKREMLEDMKKVRRMRDLFKDGLQDAVPGIKIHGREPQLPGTLHIALPCEEMDMFMAALGDGVALSFGSACMSSSVRKSHVLDAMGIPSEEINRSVRIGIGRFNTEEEMARTVGHIAVALDIARSGG